jgi:hypothetical protein
MMTTSARRINRWIISKGAAAAWLATSMTLALAGCGPLEDVVDQVGRHHGGHGTGGVSGGSGPGGGGETTPCGPKTCGAGTACCNASCGICTAPGMACTQQACVGGTGGGGGGTAPDALCLSSSECGAGELCTTETGECLKPPGCSTPGTVCPAVCYGSCQPRAPGCSPPPPPPTKCQVNADCRAFSDYCTGCDCRALANGDADPVCAGQGVLCFIDPCAHRVAVCQQGACSLVPPQR